MSDLQRCNHAATLCAITLAGVVGLGCSNADEPDTSSTEMTPESVIAALRPNDFEEYVAANPDVPLINVHVPYERHIEETDSFVAFDDIVGSAVLPEDPSAPIALYCRSGAMSAQAAADLAAAGHTRIIDLAGGMNAWSDYGGELVDDPTAVAS